MRPLMTALTAVSIAILASCGEPPEDAGPLGPTGQLRIALSGDSPLVTVAVRDVFDRTRTYLIDCVAKDHPLDGGTFCDELTLLPPGLYEVIVQSLDSACRSERTQYRVKVESNHTVEVPILLVCGGGVDGPGGLQGSPYLPGITGLSFRTAGGAPANRLICRGGEDVRVEVQVDDLDTACPALAESWRLSSGAGVDVTASYLSGLQEVNGDPCRFSALIDAAAPLGTYRLTFDVHDGALPASSITVPVDVIACAP